MSNAWRCTLTVALVLTSLTDAALCRSSASALVIGSRLYRMEHGYWTPLTHGIGTDAGFTGSFDQVMAFFFYVPNLPWPNSSFVSVAPAPSARAVLGAWYFAVDYWLPRILGNRSTPIDIPGA